MLEVERTFYEANWREWNKSNAGQFALVRGSQLVGFFATMEEALAVGAKRFGLSSFLVHRVGDLRHPIRVPAMMLGLLRGHD